MAKFCVGEFLLFFFIITISIEPFVNRHAWVKAVANGLCHGVPQNLFPSTAAP